jgi:hypothetical protein
MHDALGEGGSDSDAALGQGVSDSPFRAHAPIASLNLAETIRQRDLDHGVEAFGRHWIMWCASFWLAGTWLQSLRGMQGPSQWDWLTRRESD